MTGLTDIGERAAIERFTRVFSARSDVAVGVGDDAAVVSPDWSPDTDMILTSDAVLERIHFHAGEDAARIGHKAVARCLSDLAAMGASPDWALINLVCPVEQEVETLEQLCAGVQQLCERFAFSVVGGDTTHGRELQVHVFCTGSLPRGSAVLRSGGSPGDLLYVTGTLGGSLHGGHLEFDPRLEQGHWLRESGMVTAMVDISDGLAIDLGRLAAASCSGALLNASSIPVSPAVQASESDRRLDHALSDGEDYELLFAIQPEQQARLEQEWPHRFDLPCTAIGALQDAGEGLQIRGRDGDAFRPLSDTGYEHFRND